MANTTISDFSVRVSSNASDCFCSQPPVFHSSFTVAVLYKECIKRWKPIKTIAQFNNMMGSDCPFCRDVNDDCSECRINFRLCKQGIYDTLYEEAGQDNSKFFKYWLRKGKRLLKKNYRRAKRNEKTK